MIYTCSVCQRQIDGDLVYFRDHTEKHIVDLIKHDHPEWVEGNGACQKCADFYRAELKGSIFKDAPCALRIRKVKGFWQTLKNMFVK